MFVPEYMAIQAVRGIKLSFSVENSKFNDWNNYSTILMYYLSLNRYRRQSNLFLCNRHLKIWIDSSLPYGNIRGLH